MKKFIYSVVSVCLLMLSIGCQQLQSTDDEQLEILNPNDRNGSQDEGRSTKLGYVRYTKEEYSVDQNNEEYTIDREETANMITKTILQTGDFNEVATLVTDEEVIIAFDKNPDLNENEAADIAKKTARSILPSFYEVYTTSNPYHMDEIHSLHLETTNDKENHKVIERLINGIAEENHDPKRR